MSEEMFLQCTKRCHAAMSLFVQLSVALRSSVGTLHSKLRLRFLLSEPKNVINGFPSGEMSVLVQELESYNS